MNVLYGLLSALSWGIGDFFSGSATKKIGTYRTVFYFQLVGFLAFTIYMVLTGGFAVFLQPHSAMTWVWLVAMSLTQLIGLLLLMNSFKIGPFMLVSPIGASYSAVTIIMSLLSGDSLRGTQLAGIIAVLVGVIVISMLQNTGEEASTERQGFWRSGIPFAIVAALFLGASFWIIGKQLTPVMGGTAPIWGYRIIAPITMLLLALPLRQRLSPPGDKNTWIAVALVGLFDTIAFASFGIGSQYDGLAVLTVISSLFSVVTIVLAAVVLRERINLWQWLGILVVLVGIALVNI